MRVAAVVGDWLPIASKKRAALLLPVQLLLCGVVCAATPEDSPQGPPNIIFILADDLGYGHLGSYGQKDISTPNLDRLAAQGMRFTQAYAAAPNCAPSRSSLMTGRHGGHTSVRRNDGGIPLGAGEATLGDVLKGAGYDTGCFGKWGLGDAGTAGVPWERGFDQFFGYLHQKHAHFYYPEYLWENGRKFPLPGNEKGGRSQYSHDEIMTRAVDFIRSHKDRRFFLYLPFTLPHRELAVPEAALDQYRGRFEEPPRTTGRPGYANPKEPNATLAAMITYLDAGVGRILALLDELQLAENTVVIFTSDNGGNGSTRADFFKANGALRGYKQELFEGGIRVPAIVRWPGRVAAGAMSDKVWYFADVMPTLAELGGVLHTVPGGLDGISIVPTLLNDGRAQEEHEYLYWETCGDKGEVIAQALRQGNWKLLSIPEPPANRVMLFDLATDPAEGRDVASLHPEVVTRLLEILSTARFEPPPQIEPERPAGLDYR